MKSSYTPAQVSRLFYGERKPWWIAGGWAIDLFLGKVTREHEDVDVAILRIDEKAFRTYLKSWELWPGLGEGQLEDRAIALDEPFPEERGVYGVAHLRLTIGHSSCY